MIHSGEAATERCASSQSARGTAARHGPHMGLSSSTTGNPVSWPRSTDAFDFPAPSRPKYYSCTSP